MQWRPLLRFWRFQKGLSATSQLRRFVDDRVELVCGWLLLLGLVRLDHGGVGVVLLGCQAIVPSLGEGLLQMVVAVSLGGRRSEIRGRILNRGVEVTASLCLGAVGLRRRADGGRRRGGTGAPQRLHFVQQAVVGYHRVLTVLQAFRHDGQPVREGAPLVSPQSGPLLLDTESYLLRVGVGGVFLLLGVRQRLQWAGEERG